MAKRRDRRSRPAHQEKESDRHIMEDVPVWEHSKNPNVWILSIIILLFLLGSLGTYYFHTLKSVRLENMDVNEVRINEDYSGVVLKGIIQLYNPSALPLQIDSVTYNIILDDIIIGSGMISPTRIPAKKMTALPFEQSLSLVSTITEAITLAGKDKIPVTMKGEISMSFMGIGIKVPFREERDIRPILAAKLDALITHQKEAAKVLIGDDIVDAVTEFVSSLIGS